MLSASELADGDSSVGKRQFIKGGGWGGIGSQAPSSGAAFIDRSGAGAGGGPAGGKGSGGPGIAGEAKSAMYEAFKQVGCLSVTYAVIEDSAVECRPYRYRGCLGIGGARTFHREVLDSAAHLPRFFPTMVGFVWRTRLCCWQNTATKF